MVGTYTDILYQKEAIHSKKVEKLGDLGPRFGMPKNRFTNATHVGPSSFEDILVALYGVMFRTVARLYLTSSLFTSNHTIII